MEPVCTVETVATMATVLLAFINAPWTGTVLGTLSGGVIAYYIAKTNNKHAMLKKKKELLFSEKVRAYSYFLAKFKLENIDDENTYFDIADALNTVELIADIKLYEECKKIRPIFDIILYEKNAEKKKTYINDYVYVIYTLKELMRDELEHTLK